MVMDVGSGSEVIVNVLSFSARRESVVVRLVVSAVSVCGVPLIVTVVADDAA